MPGTTTFLYRGFIERLPTNAKSDSEYLNHV